MKKLVAIIFLVFVIGVLFYTRDFGWNGVDKKYAYERDNGLSVSSVNKGEFECCCITIENEQYEDFMAYFDVQIIEDYYIDNIRVLNAYSKFFDKKLTLSDKKYNRQIAFGENIIVGYPQIYSGF